MVIHGTDKLSLKVDIGNIKNDNYAENFIQVIGVYFQNKYYSIDDFKKYLADRVNQIVKDKKDKFIKDNINFSDFDVIKRYTDIKEIKEKEFAGHIDLTKLKDNIIILFVNGTNYDRLIYDLKDDRFIYQEWTKDMETYETYYKEKDILYFVYEKRELYYMVFKKQMENNTLCKYLQMVQTVNNFIEGSKSVRVKFLGNDKREFKVQQKYSGTTSYNDLFRFDKIFTYGIELTYSVEKQLDAELEKMGIKYPEKKIYIEDNFLKHRECIISYKSNHLKVNLDNYECELNTYK